MRGKVSIVVPAAGTGSRMRQPGRPSKQFRMLGEAPLLVHTLRVFEDADAVDEVIVAAPVDDVDLLREMCDQHGLTKVKDIVAGGDSRRNSVGRGLAATSADAVLVGVHDGVRPFLSQTLLGEVLSAASRNGAAAAAVAAVDTLRRADQDGVFTQTVSRDRLWRMQTPQVATREAMLGAFQDVGDGTDEVELLQRAGHRVSLVEGSSLNMKVTTAADLELAEALWPWWMMREKAGGA